MDDRSDEIEVLSSTNISSVIDHPSDDGSLRCSEPASQESDRGWLDLLGQEVPNRLAEGHHHSPTADRSISISVRSPSPDQRDCTAGTREEEADFLQTDSTASSSVDGSASLVVPEAYDGFVGLSHEKTSTRKVDDTSSIRDDEDCLPSTPIRISRHPSPAVQPKAVEPSSPISLPMALPMSSPTEPIHHDANDYTKDLLPPVTGTHSSRRTTTIKRRGRHPNSRSLDLSSQNPKAAHSQASQTPPNRICMPVPMLFTNGAGVPINSSSRPASAPPPRACTSANTMDAYYINNLAHRTPSPTFSFASTSATPYLSTGASTSALPSYPATPEAGPSNLPQAHELGGYRLISGTEYGLGLAMENTSQECLAPTSASLLMAGVVGPTDTDDQAYWAGGFMCESFIEPTPGMERAADIGNVPLAHELEDDSGMVRRSQRRRKGKGNERLPMSGEVAPSSTDRSGRRSAKASGTRKRKRTQADEDESSSSNHPDFISSLYSYKVSSGQPRPIKHRRVVGKSSLQWILDRMCRYQGCDKIFEIQQSRQMCFRHRDSHFPGRYRCPNPECRRHNTPFCRPDSLKRHLDNDFNAGGNCWPSAGRPSTWGIEMKKFETGPPVWLLEPDKLVELTEEQVMSLVTA